MFNVVINNEQYDEYLSLKEKIKELEARNEFLKEQYDQLNEKCQANSNHYQGLYEELVHTVHEKNETLESLYKNYQQALSDKVALIKERNEYKDLYTKQIIKRNELRFENNKIRNELEPVKAKIKEPADTIAINPYRDLEDIYLPDNNSIINIKNLCFTNNYFSEEDKNNGGK